MSLLHRGCNKYYVHLTDLPDGPGLIVGFVKFCIKLFRGQVIFCELVVSFKRMSFIVPVARGICVL